MAHHELKFTKKLFIPWILLLLFSCQGQHVLPELETVHGQKIKLYVSVSDEAQATGLSGIKPRDWPAGRGMLFVYPENGQRMFWMPNTFMDLDIFFLDKNLKVLNVARDMPHHPGTNESVVPIARTPTYYARHILELRADDPVSKSITVGQQLKWTYEIPLKEIESDIRLSK
jgi:uncharacterized membrane protein (UPF0127 family)